MRIVTQMKHLFICIFLFFGMQVYAQDYQKYHQYINTAETQLVNSRNDSAMYYYDLVFSLYDFVFVKDAVTAAQVSWKQKDTGKTQAYLIKGARCGLRTSCLNDIPILLDFMNTRAFNATYDSMKAASAQNRYYNAAMASEWDEREGELIMSTDKSEFISAVQRNAERVKQLLKEHIYPGEKYIGINGSCNDLDNVSVFNSLANYDCIMSELKEPLWEAVRRGELHPREFAALWEWEQIRSAYNPKLISAHVFSLMQKQHINVYLKENEYVKNNAFCTRGKQQFKNFGMLITANEEEQAAVNKNRTMHWISDLETDHKKQELERNENYRLFWIIK